MAPKRHPIVNAEMRSALARPVRAGANTLVTSYVDPMTRPPIIGATTLDELANQLRSRGRRLAILYTGQVVQVEPVITELAPAPVAGAGPHLWSANSFVPFPAANGKRSWAAIRLNAAARQLAPPTSVWNKSNVWIDWNEHALQRMVDRNISLAQVVRAIDDGKTIVVRSVWTDQLFEQSWRHVGKDLVTIVVNMLGQVAQGPATIFVYRIETVMRRVGPDIRNDVSWNMSLESIIDALANGRQHPSEFRVQIAP